jgi:2-methylisocitrate lyase-like PEP mutase family enzyme
MRTGFGNKLTEALKEKEIIPFIGVYDTFSASIAARSFDGIFISGFGFAASFYGLPDIGLISWSDIVAFARRVRTILPDTHILVDIDDGYADAEVAAHVVSLLEATGVSGIILEDQKRPKRCGHLDCKQILELDDFMPKLERVLETRDDMIVVARTDADEFDEAVRRVKAFDKAGADWVLVDGIGDMETVRRLRMQTGKPIVFNQIAGGKSPFFPLSELKTAGISVPLYSTPCLFAAQESIQEVMRAVKSNDGLLTSGDMSSVDLASCQALLEENLVRRDIHQ